MTADCYCAKAGLAGVRALAVDRHRRFLSARVEQCPPLSALDLFRYPVPPEGACALPVGGGEEGSFDLAAHLAEGESPSSAAGLQRLRRVLEQVVEMTGVGWIGIYQRSMPLGSGCCLVKTSYLGRSSRAVFPLSARFARHSNNSATFLDGKARVIGDVAAHQAAGGAYYLCDPEVRSEACLPIFDPLLGLLGVVDAEDARVAFFEPPVLEVLVALCLLLPWWLPPMRHRPVT